MIIYGYRSTHYATQQLSATPCSHCGTVGALRVSLVSSYAHLYWVPFFPYRKVAVLHCDACYNDWEELGLSPEIAPAVRDVKAHTRHPYWTWLGVSLLAVAIVVGGYRSLRNTRTDEALLEHPRVGDIYTVRTDSLTMYSLLKVQQVGGNNVVLVANNYQTTNDSPLDVLNDSAKYSKESFVLTRLELRIMRNKDRLTDVERPE